MSISQCVEDKKKLYNDLLKILNKLLKSAKEQCHTNKLNNFKNSKQIWSYINDNIHIKGKISKKKIDYVMVNQNKVTENKKIANSFNEFYINVANKLTENLKNNTNNDYLKYVH